MKPLSICVALFGLLALVVAALAQDASTAVLGVAAFICAFTTFRSAAISTFLKIFVGIFSIETIVFGLLVLVARAELWLKAYGDYELLESLPLSVATSRFPYTWWRSPTWYGRSPGSPTAISTPASAPRRVSGRSGRSLPPSGASRPEW
jgi:hypothetical protein